MSEINHRNSIKIEARQDGKLIDSRSIPTNQPRNTFTYVAQCLGGLHAAMQRNHIVVVAICPKWKAWILVHILRCTK